MRRDANLKRYRSALTFNKEPHDSIGSRPVIVGTVLWFLHWVEMSRDLERTQLGSVTMAMPSFWSGDCSQCEPPSKKLTFTYPSTIRRKATGCVPRSLQQEFRWIQRVQRAATSMSLWQLQHAGDRLNRHLSTETPVTQPGFSSTRIRSIKLIDKAPSTIGARRYWRQRRLWSRVKLSPLSGCYNMIGTSISSSSVDLAKPERKMIKKNKLPR